MIFILFLNLPITVSGLAKVAIFTTNIDAENQTLINHKCVCGALNRHFCQTSVICCPSVGLDCLFVLGFGLVRWLGSSFAFFSFGLCCGKKCKCATKSIGLFLCRVSFRIVKKHTCQNRNKENCNCQN